MNCTHFNNKIGYCVKHKGHSPQTVERQRFFRESHRDEIKQYKKQYGVENRQEINEDRRLRLKEDINFKIAHTLRVRINRFVRGHDLSAVDELGCTLSEVRAHLESKFLPGMNWDNHALKGWHIDHIYPLSKFDLTNEEQFKQACHYTNLQPLWAKVNQSKSAKTE